jgi:hypothetical protein
MSNSWFMRCLNEHIARLANAEDGCSGRFWEGRFKCQALLDEAALAACLAYVDLNPVRAEMEDTPEASDHTSIQRRIQALSVANEVKPLQPPELMPFVGYPRKDMPKGLAFRLEDYLTLVDWSGRLIQKNKRGAISEALPPMLQRLGIDPDSWHSLTEGLKSFSTPLQANPMVSNRLVNLGVNVGLTGSVQRDVCSVPDIIACHLLSLHHATTFSSITGASCIRTLYLHPQQPSIHPAVGRNYPLAV